MENEIVLFETEDKSITLPVQVNADTVWLNRNQLAELFGRDIKTIGKHIGNALKEELKESEVVAKFATTTRHGAIEGKTQTHLTEYYNLDGIRRTGKTTLLTEYIGKGHQCFQGTADRGNSFLPMGSQRVFSRLRGICAA